MANSPTIIKRQSGYSEPFDQQKLHTSLRAACLSVRTMVGEAEVTAERVCKDIMPWLEAKTEVTTADIRARAAEHFEKYNPDAAYAYLHHRIMA